MYNFKMFTILNNCTISKNAKIACITQNHNYTALWFVFVLVSSDCISKHFARHFVDQHIIHPMLDELSTLMEMLYVKFRYIQLPLLNLDEDSIILNHICTEWYHHVLHV